MWICPRWWQWKHASSKRGWCGDRGVRPKLPVQWASLCLMAWSSSSVRGDEEAVGVLGAKVGEASDSSLQ